MTTQFDFSNDDWDRIVATPVLVGYAVARAEDSGLIGSHREMRTLVSTIGAGADDRPARSLIDAAAASEPKDILKTFSATAPEVLADNAVEACEALVGLLAAAEPAEQEDFRRWVLEVAESVAKAAREQGSRVSPGEAALLDRVRSALAA